jgi:uncharacterized Ntn-hydrolase superfamily protein
MTYRLGPNRHTYTILGYCPRTHQLGIGIATYSLAVGGYCPDVRTALGAVSSQAFADPRLLPAAMSLLAQRRLPLEVLNLLAIEDPYFEYRQVGIVDACGRAAAHTGSKVTAWKGQLVGDGFIAMGNCLAGQQVVEAMAGAFMADPRAELSERLLRAIEAGQRSGGQNPPMNERSAALRVHASECYPLMDLRVDVHPNAVLELRRCYEAYKPYIPLYYQLRVKEPNLAPPQIEWTKLHCGPATPRLDATSGNRG